MGFCCFKCCFGCGSPDLKKKSSPKKKFAHRIHKAERVDEPDLATDEQDLVTEVIFAPAKKRHQRSKRRLTDLSPPSPASESPVPESPPPKTACKKQFKPPAESPAEPVKDPRFKRRSKRLLRGEKLIRSERRKTHDQIANKEDQMTNIQASQSRKRKEVSHTKIEKHPQKTGTGDKPSERKAERRRRAKSVKRMEAYQAALKQVSLNDAVPQPQLAAPYMQDKDAQKTISPGFTVRPQHANEFVGKEPLRQPSVPINKILSDNEQPKSNILSRQIPITKVIGDLREEEPIVISEKIPTYRSNGLDVHDKPKAPNKALEDLGKEVKELKSKFIRRESIVKRIAGERKDSKKDLATKLQATDEAAKLQATDEVAKLQATDEAAKLQTTDEAAKLQTTDELKPKKKEHPQMRTELEASRSDSKGERLLKSILSPKSVTESRESFFKGVIDLKDVPVKKSGSIIKSKTSISSVNQSEVFVMKSGAVAVDQISVSTLNPHTSIYRYGKKESDSRTTKKDAKSNRIGNKAALTKIIKTFRDTAMTDMTKKDGGSLVSLDAETAEKLRKTKKSGRSGK